jgi:hypothetical protein
VVNGYRLAEGEATPADRRCAAALLALALGGLNSGLGLNRLFRKDGTDTKKSYQKKYDYRWDDSVPTPARLWLHYSLSRLMGFHLPTAVVTWLPSALLTSPTL